MIKINLLSPSDRTSARWEKINNLIVFNLLILIIGQFFLVIIFLISIKYLDIENSKLNRQLENMQIQSEVRDVEEIKTMIGKYDKQLKIILELQEDRTAFTGILEDFSKIIPVGVKINSIDIKPKVSETTGGIKRSNNEKKDKNDATKFDFNITGTVEDRENLLSFENNLRNSEIFVDLVIDLSNYSNEDNDFRYSMAVDIN